MSPPKAGDSISPANRLSEPPPDFPEHVVACVVSAGSVDRREPVEIEEQNGDGSTAAACLARHHRDAIPGKPQVGKIGQDIMRGEAENPFVPLLALGNVLQGA